MESITVTAFTGITSHKVNGLDECQHLLHELASQSESVYVNLTKAGSETGLQLFLAEKWAACYFFSEEELWNSESSEDERLVCDAEFLKFPDDFNIMTTCFVPIDKAVEACCNFLSGKDLGPPGPIEWSQL